MTAPHRTGKSCDNHAHADRVTALSVTGSAMTGLRRLLSCLGTSVTAAITLLALCYAAVLSVLPPGGFFAGDQGVKYLQVRTLAETGRLDIAPIDLPSNVFRPSFTGPFYVEVGDQYRVKFSPAYAAVVVPAYLIFGPIGLVLPALTGVLLACFMSAKIGSVLGVHYPGAVAIISGAATPLVFYGFTLWEHALAVGCLATGCYFALMRRPYLAGAACAAGAVFRPEAYLFLPALAVAYLVNLGVTRSVKPSIQLATGAVITLLPWWLYNWISVGSPLGAHIGADRIMRWSRVASVLMHLVPSGQLKWLALLLLVLSLVVLLKWQRRPLGTALAVFWIGVSGIAFVHLLRDGFVGTSLTDAFPLTFAVLTTLGVRARHKHTLFLLTGVVSYVVGVVALIPADPGASWGPRFLLAVYPILAALAWRSIETAPTRFTQVAISTLLVVSVAVQASGLRLLYRIGTEYRALNSALSSLEPNTIATSIWWLPQLATPTFKSIQWYGVIDNHDVNNVAAMGAPLGK